MLFPPLDLPVHWAPCLEHHFPTQCLAGAFSSFRCQLKYCSWGGQDHAVQSLPLCHSHSRQRFVFPYPFPYSEFPCLLIVSLLQSVSNLRAGKGHRVTNADSRAPVSVCKFRGNAHQLCDHGEVTSPLCAPVSPCAKWGNNSTYPMEILSWLNE